MQRWLQADLAPPLRELLRGSVVLVASHRLERSDQTVEQVALGMGFRSAGRLHNIARRYGFSLAPTREIGGWRRAAVLIERRWAAGSARTVATASEYLIPSDLDLRLAPGIVIGAHGGQAP